MVFVNVSGRVFSFGGFVGALLTLNRQQYWNNGDGQVKSFWEGHNEWQGRCWGCRPPQKGGGGQTTVPFSKATLDLQTQRFLPKEVEC